MCGDCGVGRGVLRWCCGVGMVVVTVVIGVIVLCAVDVSSCKNIAACEYLSIHTTGESKMCE